MLRITSLAATAALLASTGIALAQTPSYSTDRYSTDRQVQTQSTDRSTPSSSTDRWTGTRSYQQSYQPQPSYQSQTSRRSVETDRFGTSQTERLGTNRVDRFGTTPMSGSTVEPRTTIRERGFGSTVEPRTTTRERGMGSTMGNQFASESDARARCGSDTVVWVNTRSHVYHFAGNREFGHTKRGAFMCRADAERAGTFRAARDEMPGRVMESNTTRTR